MTAVLFTKLRVIMPAFSRATRQPVNDNCADASHRSHLPRSPSGCLGMRKREAPRLSASAWLIARRMADRFMRWKCRSDFGA